LKIDPENVDYKYIAEDTFIPGNFLVVKGSAIYTTPNLVETTLVAGNLKEHGYANGRGRKSRFNGVSAIIRSPVDSNSIWVGDYNNHCIRWIDRRTTKVNHLTGKCEFRRDEDGLFNKAGIGNPLEMAVYTDRSIYFFDNNALTLKCLCLRNEKWYVKTVSKLKKQIYRIVLNPSSTFLYLLDHKGISRVSTKTFKLSDAKVIVKNRGIHADGKLNKEGSISGSFHIYFLTDDIFIVCDGPKTSLLRVVDLKKSMITSLCLLQLRYPTIRTGTVDRCKIKVPKQIIADPKKSRLIIIGLDAHYSLNYGES